MKVTIRIEADDGDLVESHRQGPHSSSTVVRALAAVADRLGDDRLDRAVKAAHDALQDDDHRWAMGAGAVDRG